MKKYLMFGYDYKIVKNIIESNDQIDTILDHWDLLDDIPEKYSDLERRIFVNDSLAIEEVMSSLYEEYDDPKYDLIFSRYESTVVIASALSEIMSTNKFLELKTALKFRDKNFQKTSLSNTVKTAKFELVSNIDNCDVSHLEINYPFISKPYNGAGTALTFLNHSQEEFLKNIKEYKSKNKRKILLEEYIKGEEYQIDGFIYKNKLVFLISKYGKPVLNITSGFLLNSITLNPKLNSKIYEELEKELLKILHKLGLNRSIFHMEFFKTSSNEWIFSECGARIGGALSNLLFEYTYNISLSEILFKLVTNPEEILKLEVRANDKYYGYSYIQPLSDKVKRLPSETKLQEKFSQLKNVVYEWKVGDELPNTALNSVKRTGMVLIEGSDTNEVNEQIEKIYQFFEELKKEGN